MSERSTLHTAIVFAAKMLRRMQRHGFATTEDAERLAAATDALLEYDDAQAAAEDAAQEQA